MIRIRPLIALALSLCGCTVGPDYVPPVVPAPPAWAESDGTRVDAVAVDTFWRRFADPTLQDLLDRAVANNRDLRVAAARLRESQVRARAAGSALWPQVDVEATYSNSRLSEHGFLQGLATGGTGGGAVFPGQQLDLHQIGFDASWELDLFGGGRRGLAAAEAVAGAAAYDLRAVLLSLCARIADDYVELRSMQRRAALAERLAATYRSAVAVLREQVQAGVADALELARTETELANREADAAAYGGEITAVQRRIEAAVASAPGGLASALAAGDLPAVPDVLAIDVPAATLRRRPDVGAAERRLAAATARIGVATAELYPRLSLTGAFGLQAQNLADLPRSDSRFWAVGPQVRWPLFDFGRVRAAIAIEDTRAAQALATYEGVVVDALADVEVALVRVARWRRQVAALERARDAARTAARLADEQYRSGVREYLDVLEVQAIADRSEDELARGDAALVHAVVALGKALGGGLRADAATVTSAVSDGRASTPP
ncbi:MAG: efflux transporter outer membrane subunit [Planctomycetota bacterium]